MRARPQFFTANSAAEPAQPASALNLRNAVLLILLAFTPAAQAREYHVALTGSDSNEGSAAEPLRHISTAAAKAEPGDTVTVHEGVYRERIDPPKGGTSETNRIVYQAARGEPVTIKGSEPVKGWQHLENATWTTTVPNTLFGNYNPYSNLIHGDWFDPKGRAHHTGAVYLRGHWLTEAAQLTDVLKPAGTNPLWFAKVDATNTTFWAQFADADPNAVEVEINVRRAVFYPSRAGLNYLTVRGFSLQHAATQWAPPTAQQIGLVGTHWSKGWVIEHNDIRYSTCVGVTLGKHGDAFDNTSQDTATGYVKTIERAVARGWSREAIGHHIVRINHISNCEQAGIAGSLGAVFSTIEGNEIHDIHVRALFGGAEMAGIKIHAAIDTEISGNHIYRCVQGIWLDWMAQGTRVTRNLLHDNTWQDLFVEVDHGPFLVDHNFFLSSKSLLDQSEGGAYAHNLFAGLIHTWPEPNRETPFHLAHSTKVAGLRTIRGGDDRFINNLVVKPASLAPYDQAAQPVLLNGNVYLNGATPSKFDQNGLVPTQAVPDIHLYEKPGQWLLKLPLTEIPTPVQPRPLVSTAVLGRALVPDLPFERPDSSPYLLDTDYLGRKRQDGTAFPGPVEPHGLPPSEIKVWPPK